MFYFRTLPMVCHLEIKMQPNFLSKCDGSAPKPPWRDFAGWILLRCVLLWWRGENAGIHVVVPPGPSRTVSALERCPVGSSAGEEPSGPALFEKTENIGA